MTLCCQLIVFVGHPPCCYCYIPLIRVGLYRRRSSTPGDSAGPNGGDNPYVAADGSTLLDLKFCAALPPPMHSSIQFRKHTSLMLHITDVTSAYTTPRRQMELPTTDRELFFCCESVFLLRGIRNALKGGAVSLQMVTFVWSRTKQFRMGR